MTTQPNNNQKTTKKKHFSPIPAGACKNIEKTLNSYRFTSEKNLATAFLHPELYFSSNEPQTSKQKLR